MFKVVIPKAKRFHSVKETNIGKVEFIHNLLDDVLKVKNQMSTYIAIFVKELGGQAFTNKEFRSAILSDYKQWNEQLPILPAHTICNLYQDIYRLYYNQFKKLTTDVIKQKLNKKPNLSKSTKDKVLKLLKLSFTNFEVPSDDVIESVFGECDNIKLKVIKGIVTTYIRYVKSRVGIRFNSGSFRLTNVGYSFEIVYDAENKKFCYFLKLKFKGKSLYIPIQVNHNYHISLKTQDYRKQLFIVDNRHHSTHKRKLYFALIKDEELTFEKVGKLLGCDVNLTSEKFVIGSNGKAVQFDRELIEQYFSFLKEIDKKGYQNLSDKDKRKLEKWTKKIEHHLIDIVARFVSELKEQGITDIVLEELDTFNGGKFRFEYLGQKFTLNRFTRLLRLTGLKNIFVQICHNRGIRVHFVHSHYTSQQCSKCGHIDKQNRKSQSEFKCKRCGYTTNADYNAAKNIMLRLLLEGYRDKYLKFDKEYGEFRTKSRKVAPPKELLQSEYEKLLNDIDGREMFSLPFLMVEFQSSGSPPMFKLFSGV
jgi:transposase